MMLQHRIGESRIAEQVALPRPGTLESMGDAQQRADLTKQRRTKSSLEQNRKEQQCTKSRPAIRQSDSIRTAKCESPAKVHKCRDVIQSPIPPCTSKLEEIRRVPMEINRTLLSLSPSSNDHASYKVTKKYQNRPTYIPSRNKQRKAPYRRGTASTSAASRSACSSTGGSAEETMRTNGFGATERISLSS